MTAPSASQSCGQPVPRRVSPSAATPPERTSKVRGCGSVVIDRYSFIHPPPLCRCIASQTARPASPVSKGIRGMHDDTTSWRGACAWTSPSFLFYFTRCIPLYTGVSGLAGGGVDADGVDGVGRERNTPCPSKRKNSCPSFLATFCSPATRWPVARWSSRTEQGSLAASRTKDMP